MKTETPGGNDLISCSFHWLWIAGVQISHAHGCQIFLIWYGCTLYFRFWVCSQFIRHSVCDFPLDFVAKWLWVFFFFFFEICHCESTKSIVNMWSFTKMWRKNDDQLKNSSFLKFDESKFLKFDKASAEHFMPRTVLYYFDHWLMIYSVYLNSFKHIDEIEKLKEYKINRNIENERTKRKEKEKKWKKKKMEKNDELLPWIENAAGNTP